MWQSRSRKCTAASGARIAYAQRWLRSVRVQDHAGARPADSEPLADPALRDASDCATQDDQLQPRRPEVPAPARVPAPGSKRTSTRAKWIPHTPKQLRSAASHIRRQVRDVLCRLMTILEPVGLLRQASTAFINAWVALRARRTLAARRRTASVSRSAPTGRRSRAGPGRRRAPTTRRAPGTCRSPWGTGLAVLPAARVPRENRELSPLAQRAGETGNEPSPSTTGYCDRLLLNVYSHSLMPDGVVEFDRGGSDSLRVHTASGG